jgi:hypothetical protein
VNTFTSGSAKAKKQDEVVLLKGCYGQLVGFYGRKEKTVLIYRFIFPTKRLNCLKVRENDDINFREVVLNQSASTNLWR